MHKKLKNAKFLTNRLFFISLITTFIFCILCVGGGGVLNDYDIALKEMKTLEKNNFENLSSQSISAVTKREINFFKNSKEFQDYIIEQEKLLEKVINAFYLSISILLITIFLKLFFRFKSKNFMNKNLQ